MIVQTEGMNRCYAAASGVSFRLRVDSFAVGAGEAVGIIGPNGSGKSTFLEMLALISAPDSAARFFLHLREPLAGDDGYAVDIAALWQVRSFDALAALRSRAIGFVHQAGNLYPFFTVYENIAMPLRLRGENAASAHSGIRSLAAFLSIEHLLAKMPATLSYGERQRVAIARALVHRPQLVLADEPTSSLDPETAGKVVNLLVSGAREMGTALVIASHDVALLRDAGISLICFQRSSCGKHDAPGPDAAADAVWTVSRRNTDGSAQLAESAESDTAAYVSSCAGAYVTHRFGGGRAAAMCVCLIMAWRDFLHERGLSLCGVLAFSAALTPMLLLAGLRYGIVETLSQRLINNPNALAVNPYSSIRYTPELLARLAEHPSVAFLVPRTRKLAAAVTIITPGGKAHNGDIVPTAEGDPLLARYSLGARPDGLIITQQAARALPGVSAGDTVSIKISRFHNGRLEYMVLPQTVLGILPDAADWQNHIYAPLPLAESMESYRDGLDMAAGAAGRSYAGFRMYVKTLDDVLIMRDFLMKEGIEAYTFAREVETLQTLGRSLSVAAIVIGCATLAGMCLSLASLAVSNVRRKERIFAQARLMGLYSRELALFPVLQMFFCAASAASVCLALYRIAAFGLDWAYAAELFPGESICRITAWHVFVLYAASFLLACLCCLGACKKLLTMQPAEVLRRNV